MNNLKLAVLCDILVGYGWCQGCLRQIPILTLEHCIERPLANNAAVS